MPRVRKIVDIEEAKPVDGNDDATSTTQGCRGLVVKASGWPSFDRQFEPYLRAL